MSSRPGVDLTLVKKKWVWHSEERGWKYLEKNSSTKNRRWKAIRYFAIVMSKNSTIIIPPSIPNFISIMPNLKYFGIEGNDVKNIRRDIIQCGAPRILRHLRQSFEPTKLDVNESSSFVTSAVNCPDKYEIFH